MGALRLTYQSGTPTLKVVWNTLKESANSCTGAYRFGFNGQEKDDEITGVTGSHLNFKFRMYDSRVARFFAVDPLASKYPYWTPYQFAGLMPIWYRELEGLEPGKAFATETDAALNFSSIYGEFSIQENREYGAAIYSYTDKSGTTQYTYNNPKRGGKSSVGNSNVRKKVGKEEAGIHSHGAWDKDYIDASGTDWNNEFSGTYGDKGVADANKYPEYVTTPKGTLRKYDPATKSDVVVDSNSPSDPNDPTQVNKNSAIVVSTSRKQTRQDRRTYTKQNRETRKIYKEDYKEIVKSRK